MGALCDHSSNVYGSTPVYVHEDGAECLPIGP